MGPWETVNKIRVEFARRFAHVAIEVSDVMCWQQYTEQLQSRDVDVLIGRRPFAARPWKSNRFFKSPWSPS